MIKPGERTAHNQKKYKHAHGEGANSVANRFLASRKGRSIQIETINNEVMRLAGVMQGFDMYSIHLNVDGEDVLVYKGPGLIISSAEPSHGS